MRVPPLEPLPDHLDGPDDVPRIVSREHALRLGLSKAAIEHRLRVRRWHWVLPHTYLTGNTLTWADRLEAAVVFAGEGALLTGAAALADLGLRTVERPDSVLVLVPASTRLRPAGWVRLRRTHRMPPRAALPGTPRAEPSRAVADLALERHQLDDVRTLVSQAVRARLCSVDDLWAELATGPRQGSAHLRTALVDASDGAWSAPEGRVVRILRRCAVPDFVPNAAVRFSDGSQLIVDVLWPGLRAVLEIDSDEHHWRDPADRDRTVARHSLLQTNRFTVMSRRPARIAADPLRFLRDVDAWLAARAAELATRPA